MDFRLLQAAGPDGISKVVEKFIGSHPLFAKRQVELKINEIAVKEKRENDSCKVWHIKPEFLRFVDPSGAAPKKAEDEMSNEGGGKRKSLSGSAESPPSKKMKKDVPSEEPKKYKRAFGFFVRAKRSEAEKRVGQDGSVS